MGVIGIQQRSSLGRKKPSLIFRAGEITILNVVMAGDPLVHLYAGVLLVTLPAILNAFG